MFALPLAPEKLRSAEFWLVELAGTGGLCMAERAMYVSMHLAVGQHMRQYCSLALIRIHVGLRTNYRLLKLAGLVQVEQLAGAQCKDHALVVLLQLVVDFCCHERRQLAVRE